MFFFNLKAMQIKTMRVAFIVFFTILTIVFLAITLPFLKAAFLAFTLVVIFVPLHNFFLKIFRFRNYISAFVTTIIIGVCVVIPLVVLGTLIVIKTGSFLEGFASEVERGDILQTINNIATSVHNWMLSIFGSAPDVSDMIAGFINLMKTAGRKFYEFSPRMLSTTASVIINFLLMFLFLVVFLAEGTKLNSWIASTVPFTKEHWKEMTRNVRVSITSSILAALVIAVIQGSLMGIGFWIVGFDHPYEWWIIAILLSIIPVVGALSCYVTASIVLFTSGNVNAGIIFLILGIGVVSTVDNFIRPLMLRGSIKIHPVLIFVTLVGAVKLIGPIGLLVGPVLLAIFLSSLQIYRREFTGNKS